MNILSKLADYIVTCIGKIYWDFTNGLTSDELQQIRVMLKSNYYIILTRNNNYLSSYAISLGNFLLTGKWGYWAHALMNFEDTVSSDDDFRLVQATGKGVGYATFENVFRTNSTVLLAPKNMTVEEWTLALDRAKSDIGKPYDTLFDLKDASAMSCVELVRDALLAIPDYESKFAHFESMIAKHKKLTPDMFYMCPDFEVIYEIRHR